MDNYLLLLVINAVFHQQITDILAGDAQDDCHSHWQCAGSSSYCCREYNVNSGRSCRMNVSSCLDRFCTSNHECVTPDECCWSNKCTNCSFCAVNSDCGTAHYCCNSRSNGSKCSPTCIGEICQRYSDCGAPDECCRSGKCVKCSNAGCSDNYACPSGEYCCVQDIHVWLPNVKQNHCNASCIGRSCHYHGDCGGPGECCQSNKCVKCPYTVCKRSRDCNTGQYCCGREPKGICSESCLGESCAVVEQCAGRECCNDDNVCAKVGCMCFENHHCSDGLYCCLGPKEGWHCNTSCLGKSCISHHGCGGMALGEWCRDGVCVTDQCNSHFYCDIKDYSCCWKFGLSKSELSARDCKTQCINKSCSSNSLCATSNETECCSTPVPTWLILVIVTSSFVFLFGVVTFVIKYCWSKRTHDLGTFQKPSQDDNIVPYTIF